MIIGICGLAGSGKGTVADILIRDFGFEKISFADGVKDACSVVFGWKRELLEGDTEESRKFRETVDEFWSKALNRPGFTPRIGMQLMGTEAGRRVFGSDLWVQNTFKRIQQSKHDRFVIPDVRFREEISGIEQNSGVVIQIERGPRPDFWAETERLNKTKNDNPAFDIHEELDILAAKYKTHTSELAWIGAYEPRAEIKNNGSIDDLEYAVKILLSRI